MFTRSDRQDEVDVGHLKLVLKSGFTIALAYDSRRFDPLWVLTDERFQGIELLSAGRWSEVVLG